MITTGKSRPEVRQRGLIFSILVSTLILDLVSKEWARRELEGHVYRYLGDLLVFEHSENPGAFLSLGATLSPEFRFWIFTIGIAAITLGVLIFMFRTKNLPRLQTIAYSLIVAGGIGNLVDRIQKQTVTDFINMGIGSLRTGIFNVADMAIMAAVFILIFESFRNPDGKSRK
jgi:signal peptidase II